MYQYQHGGDIYSEGLKGKSYVDFSANINPLGLPEGVKQAIVACLDECVNYPDPYCRELTEAVANFLQLPKEQLYFGNGAADVLFRIAQALQPKQTLLLAPTFADYEKALRLAGSDIVYYNLKEAEGYRVDEEILAAVNDRLDAIVLCNPNNPTGCIMEQKLLEAILQKALRLNIRVLIDECFMDFVAFELRYTMLRKLSNYPNLVILKAFTKTYAMPGIRLGFCVSADLDFIDSLHGYGQDWNVSVLAQKAGIAALKEQAYVAEAINIITAERAYLKQALTALGATVYDSQANYILFKLEQPEDLVPQMQAKGFLVRSCANYHNLSGAYYRIAVKNSEDNKAFIMALQEIQGK